MKVWLIGVGVYVLPEDVILRLLALLVGGFLGSFWTALYFRIAVLDDTWSDVFESNQQSRKEVSNKSDLINGTD